MLQNVTKCYKMLQNVTKFLELRILHVFKSLGKDGNVKSHKSQ